MTKLFLNQASIDGEKLREAFWPSKRSNDLGCYNNFEYNTKVYDIFRPTDPEVRKYVGDNSNWASLVVEGIVIHLQWDWDGDGNITFTWTDPKTGKYKVLNNDDCKKPYNWQYL